MRVYFEPQIKVQEKNWKKTERKKSYLFLALALLLCAWRRSRRIRGFSLHKNSIVITALDRSTGGRGCGWSLNGLGGGVGSLSLFGRSGRALVQFLHKSLLDTRLLLAPPLALLFQFLLLIIHALAVDIVIHHFVGGLEDSLAPAGDIGVCLFDFGQQSTKVYTAVCSLRTMVYRRRRTEHIIPLKPHL